MLLFGACFMLYSQMYYEICFFMPNFKKIKDVLIFRTNLGLLAATKI